MSRKEIIVSNVSKEYDNPIAELVQVACQFDSNIILESNNRKINAKSIMGMMTLALKDGEEVTVVTDGADEEKLLSAASENAPDDEHYPLHIAVFDELGNAISYCASLSDIGGVDSMLYKYEGRYYLWVEKKRRSWVNYYTMISKALDFGSVMHGGESEFSHIRERGECLIGSNAIRKLRAAVAARKERKVLLNE